MKLYVFIFMTKNYIFMEFKQSNSELIFIN